MAATRLQLQPGPVSWECYINPEARRAQPELLHRIGRSYLRGLLIGIHNHALFKQVERALASRNWRIRW